MENGSFKRRQASEQPQVPKKRKISLFAWVPKPIKRFWRRYNLTRVLLLVVTLFLVFITGYLYYLSKAANVGVLQQSLGSQTTIIDNKGQVADTLAGSKGTQINFNQIPKDAQQALVATEDRTFYRNDGVNFERTLFAFLTLGHFGGGSTITQQLAKNAYLTQQQTVDRKAREIFLALQITKHYSKEEIMTMYFNSNYYGNNVWGLQDASHKYFGVDASQLNLSESATLVGLLKGPEIYNPLVSITYATERRNTVLQNMVNAGYITQDVANATMKISIQSELSDNYVPAQDAYKYPSYDNAVLAEAQVKYHLTSSQITNNGYKIYTGLNQQMQQGMQATYDASSLFPTSVDGTTAQSASVATDPKTGAVLALVGNVPTANYNSLTDFNYATMSKRSTGSAIKPLIAYAPAIEAGWSIDKTVYDNPTTYPGDWSPQDDSGEFLGAMPMYQALANSYNIPAINTYQTIGPSTGNALGRKFGLDLTSKNDILPTVLGSGVQTNPWQMAQAYSAFANGGMMNSQHLITKIENAAGQVVAQAQVTQTQVISQDTANKMTQMMLGTFTNGSAWNAAPYGYNMAGKTGTNNTTDQWVIGYTPDVVIALWVGFPTETDANLQLQGTSEGQTSVVFRQEASYLLPYTPGTKFDVQNAYAAHGIYPITPAYTYQRQLQDGIVQQEQAQTGTTGNATSPSVGTSPSSSGGGGIGKTIKDIWDKFTGLFK